MKPQLRPPPIRRLSHHDGSSEDCRLGPLIEWEFQPPRLGDFFGGDDWPQRRPGLSRLTKEVLLEDASRPFRSERAVLGLVALVSAWPIVSMIQEVIRLLKLIFA
jgi:hypothetical protein